MPRPLFERHARKLALMLAHNVSEVCNARRRLRAAFG
jgi:hypothetical protein